MFLRLSQFCQSLAGRFLVRVVHARRIRCAGKVKITGKPLLRFDADGRVILGKDVRLNSSNRSYHMNMWGPVKLMADRPGAVIEIGEGTRVNGSCIHAYKRVTIGRNCLIAANCQIVDGPGHDLSFDNPANRVNTVGDAAPITIGDNVWIAAQCVILPGVTIGDGSVVAAGSIVTKDIPPMSLAGGNPAKVIRQYE